MARLRDERSKRQKIDEILLALRDYHDGLTRAEIARKIGIGRADVTKYFDGGDLPGVHEDNGRLKLERLGDLVRMTLDRDEVTILHVAARLLVHHSNETNPHVASALRKLSEVVSRQDHDVGLSFKASATLADGSSIDGANEVANTLRVLTEARIRRINTVVEYELDDGARRVRYEFEPYFIEPYAAGLTTHVIGRRTPPGELRTFKVERLRNAKLGLRAYEIPADFDPQMLLNDAWGIWYTNAQPMSVVLKFSSKVRRRVLETRWHRNQEEPQVSEDGSVLWRCLIAEPREMLPWIRGWGADVEVMEPADLREEVRRGARDAARVYGLAATTAQEPATTRALRCWGKTDNGDTFHPALFHMLDVANVARVLLDKESPCRWRRALASALGCSEDTLREWVPYYVALHDIGKISAPFQAQNPDQLARLQREGFSFDNWRKADFIRHEVISRIYTQAADPPESLRYIREVIGGHHGAFSSGERTREAKIVLRREHGSWEELRKTGDALLRNQLLKQPLDALSAPPNVSVAIMALTGFIILCDWLGSDGRFFRPAPNDTWEDYVSESEQRAMRAVESSGLLAVTKSDSTTAVRSLFADLANLRQLQLAIDDIPESLLATPTLTIIEAPTGEGKTEAALALAHRIARSTGTDEMFYALPTMATSNQMFGRLQKHLRQRLGLATQVKLAHGQAFLIEEDLRAVSNLSDTEPLGNGDQGQAQRDALDWFSGKKRALLAPFGVGTVDQIELAVLNVKHLALRMGGLVGKVVVIDEVHAYDTYMTTILERLLNWLAKMGTSVILLSATLPLSRRARLLGAYGATATLAPKDAIAYPSLIAANSRETHIASPQPWQPNRQITLGWLSWGDDDAAVDSKARWLLDQIVDGGCACWIANTVKRAQRLFSKLRELAPEDVSLELLHSQFPLEDRQNRENELSRAYGRNENGENRPARAVVVGTQVLEQSLDLDFDVMVSDLAPVDLILQRAGRLHRHVRSRPAAHAIPKFWVNCEADPAGNLKQGSDRSIYAAYIMRMTHLTLAAKSKTPIALPADYRILIEAVYGAALPKEGEALYEDWVALQSVEDKAFGEAQRRLVPIAHAEDSFAETIAHLSELSESETDAGYLVAQTRLGEPSLNVIPLERDGDRVRLGDRWLSANAEATKADQLLLLRRHLRISNPEIITAISAQPQCSLFSQSRLLEGYFPIWLDGAKASLESSGGRKLIFTLDPYLGLIVDKESKYGKTEDKSD